MSPHPLRVALDGMLLRGRFTGVEMAIVHLARALARRARVEVDFPVPAPCPHADIEGPRFHTRRIGALTHYRPTRIFWEQALQPALARARGADVIHAPGYIAPLFAGPPVVLTVYDAIALSHPEWCTFANRWHYSLMLPASVRKAARVLVPSECTRDELLRHCPAAAAKMRVIPLGVADEYFSPPPAAAIDAARARHGMEGGAILFVGQSEPKKNLPALVRAYHLLRQGGRLRLPLVLAGHQTHQWPALWALVQSLGLQGEVRATGYVAQADMPALYAAATAFVFPSWFEGFGIPPLEAMACGLPVVTSTGGALPETVGGAALTVAPDDVAGMAEAIERALTDRALRARLIAAGRERAARYRWDTVAERVEAVYAECARPGAAP